LTPQRKKTGTRKRILKNTLKKLAPGIADDMTATKPIYSQIILIMAMA
jgi:hypothetical protein